jgi:hypothetical protein
MSDLMGEVNHEKFSDIFCHLAMFTGKNRADGVMRRRHLHGERINGL